MVLCYVNRFGKKRLDFFENKHPSNKLTSKSRCSYLSAELVIIIIIIYINSYIDSYIWIVYNTNVINKNTLTGELSVLQNRY